MEMHIERAGKCTAGSCTERRGHVRAEPRIGGVILGKHIRREGEICGDGAVTETGKARAPRGSEKMGEHAKWVRERGEGRYVREKGRT